MLETMLCQNETILIASNMYPAELVKNKLMKIDIRHVNTAYEAYYVVGV